MKTSSHGSRALVFCPMAANIEQVLQALGQVTEILRLMAVTQETQAQQTQAAAQQAQPGNRRGDEPRGVGLDERYFRRVEKLESHNNWRDFGFQFATAVKLFGRVSGCGVLQGTSWQTVFDFAVKREIQGSRS